MHQPLHLPLLGHVLLLLEETPHPPYSSSLTRGGILLSGLSPCFPLSRSLSLPGLILFSPELLEVHFSQLGISVILVLEALMFSGWFLTVFLLVNFWI